jgi:Rrf2 family transcriptional regulator, iron-sulfur cluster assembly transcription factor
VKLSKESKYGLTGVLYLATQPEGTVRHVGEIAEATGIAYPFLAKICSRLAGGGILRSYRGRARGYGLARPAATISVREVVEAIEGPDLFRRCVFWSDACSESHPCVMHELWRQVRPRMADLMERTSVADLARTRGVTGNEDPVRPSSIEEGADRVDGVDGTMVTTI